jgi:hypothetical protein
MKQLLERSVVVVIAVSLAVFVMPVADTFGQSVPAAVSASKVRTTAGTPFDYTVTFTVRATRANICDIEIQLADPWDTLVGFTLLPTNWSVQTGSSEANAIAAEADGLPTEANCIKKGKTGQFKVQVNPGTPPCLFNICFSDKDGALIGSCLKLEVSSFAVYPAPSADVMVTQHGKQLEFEARPELEGFIQSMSIAIFDIGGRLLSHQEVSGHRQTVSWTGLGAQGQPLAKGVYLAVVTLRGMNGEVLRKVHKFVVR